MNTDTVHVPCAHCGATNRIPAARLADDPVCGRCGAVLLDGRPIELTDADFDRVAGRSDLPVVVDFWAPWCGPCHAMAPQFDAAAASLRGKALLVRVNSDENPRLAGRFGIRSIPTLLRLDNGQESARSSGALPLSNGSVQRGSLEGCRLSIAKPGVPRSLRESGIDCCSSEGFAYASASRPTRRVLDEGKFYKCLIGRTSSGLPCLFNAPSDRTKPLPAGMLVEVRNLKSIRARPITLRGGNDQ